MQCPCGFNRCQKEDCDLWDGWKCTAYDITNPDHERDQMEV